MIDTSTWAVLASPACLALAPANLGLRPDVDPPPDSDLTFMATAVAMVGDVPISTILTHGPRARHLRAEVQRTADSLDEVLAEGQVEVAGATAARWVRGHWVLEGALTEDGHELLTRVVVALPRELASLVVRVPRGSEHGCELADAVVASLQVVQGPRASRS